MATVQSTHLLSVNGLTPGNSQTGFPATLQPTVASPCPVWGLSNTHIQGVSNPTAAQLVAFPACGSVVTVDYFVSAQKTTAIAYLSETVAAIIAAS